MAVDLITTTEYLTAAGKKPSETDATEEGKIGWAITGASHAVRSYADRDFTPAAVAPQGPRQFRYYGNGILDIDDCTAINSVSTLTTSFAISRTLDSTEWFALPGEDQMLDFLELYSIIPPTGVSPEMGFKRNLDTYPFVPYPSVIQVDAAWGWPSIPEPIKQAVFWTAAAFMADPQPYSAESIAGYSRSYSQSGRSLLPGLVVQALPDRAAALLDPYTRWPV